MGSTRLNPCFRGSWFDGPSRCRHAESQEDVLILVFVEVGLMACQTCSHLKWLTVLILVFVEVGLMG